MPSYKVGTYNITVLPDIGSLVDGRVLFPFLVDDLAPAFERTLLKYSTVVLKQSFFQAY